MNAVQRNRQVEDVQAASMANEASRALGSAQQKGDVGSHEDRVVLLLSQIALRLGGIEDALNQQNATRQHGGALVGLSGGKLNGNGN